MFIEAQIFFITNVLYFRQKERIFMETKGKVFKYPDNVDTDVIIPARYLNTPDAAELALPAGISAAAHRVSMRRLLSRPAGSGA